MFKRFWWVFLVMAAVATIIWLSRNPRNSVEEDRLQSATNHARKLYDLSGRPDEGSAPLESQRHASGEVEKHRLEKTQLTQRQLKNQIDTLLKYENDQLMIYAAGIDSPDNVIRKLFPQYLEAKRQLSDLKLNGLGDRHPTVLVVVENIDGMKRLLDEGVIHLRTTLQAQLEMIEGRLKKGAR